MNDSSIETNNHLQDLIDSVDELMVMKDGRGRWLAANRTARVSFQLLNVDYRGKTDNELAARVPALHPFLSMMANNDARAWAARAPLRLEECFTAPDGTTITWELILTPHFDEQGWPLRLTVVSRNIAERKRIEAELRESEARYRLIAEHMTDVIGMTDLTGQITYVSPSVAYALGYESQNLIGDVISRVVHLEEREAFQKAWTEVCADDQAQRRIECRCRHLNGGFLWFEVELSTFRNEGGAVEKVVFSAREMTERKQQDLLLLSMAFRDPLTQILNRRALMDRLQAEMRVADDAKDALALLYMDLDGFKPINDRWGHEAGDELLVQLTQQIQSGLRGSDSFARLGGDEFVVLLPGVGRDEALSIASRVCHALDTTWSLGPGRVAASASIGVALYPAAGSTADELLHSADLALYEAKAAGRACVRLYDAQARGSFR